MIPSQRPHSPGRYERKFVISDTSLKVVEAQLMLHPALFREIHHNRLVNNIYLDSPEYRNFFDNLEGNARRRKVRVRWYGDLRGTAKAPVLEIKEKSGHIGWKRSFPLPDFIFSDRLDARILQIVLEQADLPLGLIQELRTLRPVLVNRYHRKYLMSWDGNFRITLDDQLSYYRINHLYSSFSFPNLDDQYVILELKYLEEHDAGARFITNGFHWRISKNSKYVSGLLSLTPS